MKTHIEQNTQDNVLIEYLGQYFVLSFIYFDQARYECALLLNIVNGIPVVPVLLGEVSNSATPPTSNPAIMRRSDEGSGNIITPFNMGHMSTLQLPETPHKRGEDAQRMIDDLRLPVLFLLFPFLMNKLHASILLLPLFSHPCSLFCSS